MLLSLVLIVSVGAMDTSTADNNVSINSMQSGTWCWFGTCGHPARRIMTLYYPTIEEGNSWYINSTGTEYEFLGRYVDAGNSATISETVSYSLSISTTFEGGTEYAKASIGISETSGWEFTYSDTLNNLTSTRQYVHAGVEYEERKSYGLGLSVRTFYPFEHLTAFSKYCEYSEYEYTYPSARVPVAEGYSLLPNKVYSNNITIK